MKLGDGGEKKKKKKNSKILPIPHEIIQKNVQYIRETPVLRGTTDSQKTGKLKTLQRDLREGSTCWSYEARCTFLLLNGLYLPSCLILILTSLSLVREPLPSQSSPLTLQCYFFFFFNFILFLNFTVLY